MPHIESRIIQLRGKRVILSADLAEIYGIEHKKFNQQVARNEEKFEGFAFKLTKEEFAALRSQTVTSKPGRGGTRYPPWAFTEHGVVMVATVISTEKAIKMSRLIVEVFVDVAKRLGSEPVAPVQALQLPVPENSQVAAASPEANADSQVQTGLLKLLNAIAPPSTRKAASKETKELAGNALQWAKDYMAKPGVSNEKVRVEIGKIMAEIEAVYTSSAKTQAETEAIILNTNIRKMLVLLTMEQGDMEEIMEVLKGLCGLSA
jgi:hypothetical protein